MNFFQKIKTFIRTHKKTSIAIVIVVILVGYWGYKKATNTSGETRYVLAQAEIGTIISSVTGTGQVSASNQIDIKPKVSGTITSVAVKPGDKVSAGQTLFYIDSTTAEKALRDAKINLEGAKLSLRKLQIQNSTENTNANLNKAYSDGFNSVSATFVDLPTTITGLQNILNQNNLSDNAARGSGTTALNYRNSAENDYYKANDAYQKNKTNFGLLDYSSPHDKIDALINETYKTTELTATAVKSLNDYVNYLAQDTGRSSDFSSYQTTLSGYTTSINGHLSSLSATETNIKNYKDAIPNSNLDLESAQITVTQRENAVSDAEQTLSDYAVTAPFAGEISSVPVQKGEVASSGTSMATIITASKLAEISLNEVDVAKISLGQKATLTFDAIPDLSLTGKVTQIDTVGTVSQGVVNYNVQIGFDTDDARVKPGMSVSADIITNVKQSVLTIPSSAVKTRNGASYVQIFNPPIIVDTSGASTGSAILGTPSTFFPTNQPVETGATSDTLTEIISGLKVGDQIVIKTIAASSTTTQAPSIFGATGTNRGNTPNAGRALRGN